MTPSFFFDLTEFAHKALFPEERPVWHALDLLSEYLLSCQLGKIEGEVMSEAHLVDPESISIGKGSVVEAGAYIKGPCIIGENCQIRHGAYLRGNVLTGNGCVIGHATEVKNAIFLDSAAASHFAYVGDSILGNGVNLGAGTKCANLRFDRGLVKVFFEGQWLDTGRKKLGAVFGDQSQTGCNSVTNPGTFLVKETILPPNSTRKGVIFPESTLAEVALWE
ncbi:MAG: Bifunctional protein GlmU [Chlamydiae bacterium]|nr:Bifunctional protein GlmU [Chlamydiota bacterium]